MSAMNVAHIDTYNVKSYSTIKMVAPEKWTLFLIFLQSYIIIINKLRMFDLDYIKGLHFEAQI
jgi:hypothetical protein